MVFKTYYRLMRVKNIAECSNGSILQHFRPSLTYHVSLRSLFVYFLWPFYTGFTVDAYTDVLACIISAYLFKIRRKKL